MLKAKLFSVFFALGSLIFVYSSCENNETYYQGHSIYDSVCANCHMEDGTGLKGLIPPLANSDYLRDNQMEVACLIRYGMEGEVVVNGKTYNQPMAGIPYLTDTEIANIINYINHAWGNDYGSIPFKDMRAKLKECAAEEEEKKKQLREERIKKMENTES